LEQPRRIGVIDAKNASNEYFFKRKDILWIIVHCENLNEGKF